VGGQGPGRLGRRVKLGEGRVWILGLKGANQASPTPLAVPRAISHQRMGINPTRSGEHPEEAVKDSEPFGGRGTGFTCAILNHPVQDTGLVDYEAWASRGISNTEAREELGNDVAIPARLIPVFSRGGDQVLGPDPFRIGPLAAGALFAWGHRRSSPTPRATSRNCSRAILVYRCVTVVSRWPR
jgi:hypothetical protein